jgi:integrase/recombinase XerD
MSRRYINLKIVENQSPNSNIESVKARKHSTVDLNAGINKWLDFCKAEGLSESSLWIYQNSIGKFAWWFETFVNLPLDEITSEHAISYVAYLKTRSSTRWGEPVIKGKEKLSAASVSTYVRGAKVFFNWLEERRMIEATPFNRSVKVTSKKDPVIGRYHKNLQEGQLETIFNFLTEGDKLKTYTGTRNLAVISLLVDSGMRRGELISMRVGDIEWHTRRITIRGKTGERTCFFTPSAESALLLYFDNFRKLQKDLLESTSPFWLSIYGAPLTVGGLSSILNDMSKRCGLKFSAHQFRHSFASFMVSRIGVYELKELLGHSSINTTMIYTHGSPDKLQESHRSNSPLSILEVGQLKAKSRRGRKPGSRNLKDDEVL